MKYDPGHPVTITGLWVWRLIQCQMLLLIYPFFFPSAQRWYGKQLKYFVPVITNPPGMCTCIKSLCRILLHDIMSSATCCGKSCGKSLVLLFAGYLFVVVVVAAEMNYRAALDSSSEMFTWSLACFSALNLKQEHEHVKGQAGSLCFI